MCQCDEHVLQGVWKPSKIANPDYFEDKEPLKNLDPIGAVAVEIWTMDQGYYFDNVLVSNDGEKAKEYREKYWQPKHEVEEVCLQLALLLSGAQNCRSLACRLGCLDSNAVVASYMGLW